MMEDLRKISVMIPTFNRGEFICECIESVLSQGIHCSQIVIVDDGSTDNTKREVSPYIEQGLTYWYQDHQGISSARNRCLSLSRGELLAFVDSDDIWQKGKIPKQLEYFKVHPDCSIVFTKYKNFLNGTLNVMDDVVEREFKLEAKNSYSLPTALFKREILSQVGEFDQQLSIGEDVEWIMRMRLRGISVDHCINEPLYLRRLHGKNSIFLEKRPSSMMAKLLAAQMRKKILRGANS